LALLVPRRRSCRLSPAEEVKRSKQAQALDPREKAGQTEKADQREEAGPKEEMKRPKATRETNPREEAGQRWEASPKEVAGQGEKQHPREGSLARHYAYDSPQWWPCSWCGYAQCEAR
jgi:hypothetical protein